MTIMKKLLISSCLPWLIIATFAASSPKEVTEALQKSKVRGGFVVHLGTTDGAATAALRPNESYQVHALVGDASKLDAVRKDIRKKAETYGTISADIWDGGQLPYVDNLVNLLLIEEGVEVGQKEILRVLTPLGKAYQRKD